VREQKGRSLNLLGDRRWEKREAERSKRIVMANLGW
jgi:hypothetical protein